VDPAARRRLIEYVRPLAVGLDGVTNFGDAERAVAASETIAGSRTDLDRDLLFLLALFSGQDRWVSRMGHRSRTEIFLDSVGVSPRTVQRLFRGLARFETAPSSPEEEIVGDAVALEKLGAYGIVRCLVEGYKERLDVGEMAASLQSASEVPVRTEAGRSLAEPRRRVMRDFARRLREELEEFGRTDDP
jgi:hypothetical protein